MADVFALLENHFPLIFGVAVLLTISQTGYSAWRRYRRGPIHPPYDEHELQFNESSASGFSHKSLFTRYGGARKVLVVKVLPGGLLIEPSAVFKWLTPTGFNDLEHYIPKSDIVRVSPSSHFGMQTIRIDFRRSTGEPGSIEISLRNPRAFCESLRS